MPLQVFAARPKLALRPVNRLSGESRARDFGPKALKVVMHSMVVDENLCRTEINRRLSRIKRAFKWAVSEELIPASIVHGLQSVTGLKKGRSAAREKPPVKPVSPETVEATLPFLSPQVAAICRLQLLTGMRPSEVLNMRPYDIDRSGELWVYRLSEHKTDYLDIDKEVPLGRQAQQVLLPFLNRADEEYCFKPAEAEEWRNGQRATHRDPHRKTKIFPSELRSRERRRSKRREQHKVRTYQPKYNPVTYRRAIEYALKRAAREGVMIPHWFP